MTHSTRKEVSDGFSIVEVGLVVVVVVVIGALGYVFYQNNIAKKPVASVSDTAVHSSPSSQPVAPAGTTASIDQLTQQAAAAESGVDSNADSQTSDNATSANGAVSNVGGAYDENNL